MYAICISRSVVKQEVIHFSVEGPRTDSALKVVELHKLLCAILGEFSGVFYKSM